MTARPVKVRYVLAGDEVEERQCVRPRRDVVGPGGDDEQILLDASQVHALAAQP
ncbi:MAG: hypothetical protein M3065_22195 [Actinomycetota bacterium]|nr:hypothetical protein [Actinomycetota bacterium]